MKAGTLLDPFPDSYPGDPLVQVREEAALLEEIMNPEPEAPPEEPPPPPLEPSPPTDGETSPPTTEEPPIDETPAGDPEQDPDGEALQSA